MARAPSSSLVLLAAVAVTAFAAVAVVAVPSPSPATVVTPVFVTSSQLREAFDGLVVSDINGDGSPDVFVVGDDDYPAMMPYPYGYNRQGPAIWVMDDGDDDT